MGRHAQTLRDIIHMLPTPKDVEGFTPEIAAHCLAMLANKALRIVQDQEEIIEDLEQEVTKLQAKLIEQGKDWAPPPKEERSEVSEEVRDLFKKIARNGKQKDN
jgi:hypothetical protein